MCFVGDTFSFPFYFLSNFLFSFFKSKWRKKKIQRELEERIGKEKLLVKTFCLGKKKRKTGIFDWNVCRCFLVLFLFCEWHAISHCSVKVAPTPSELCCNHSCCFWVHTGYFGFHSETAQLPVCQLSQKTNAKRELHIFFCCSFYISSENSNKTLSVPRSLSAPTLYECTEWL